MTNERRNEIAYLGLKNSISREKIDLQNLKRNLGNRAKEINIELSELAEFSEIILREIIEETFKKNFKKGKVKA